MSGINMNSLRKKQKQFENKGSVAPSESKIKEEPKLSKSSFSTSDLPKKIKKEPEDKKTEKRKSGKIYKIRGFTGIRQCQLVYP